jgi:photosystem II stability/assembly factor-like uncharacterized protein
MRCFRFFLLWLNIVGFAIAAFSQSPQWHTLANAPLAEGRFDDVFFINPSVGWIVEVGASKIYKTIDGGESWDEVLDGGDAFGYHVGFRCIGFVDDQLGWSGNLNFHNNPIPGRSLFETRDGGDTWENISDRITGFDPAGICGLWVVDSQTIYGTGRWNGPPVFVKTIDGGMNWSSEDMRPLVTGLVDVFFFNPDTGFVVGGHGVGSSLEEQRFSKAVILYTEDGGDFWRAVYHGTDDGYWCWKISFPSRKIGYVSTQGDVNPQHVLKTIDGGLTWDEITIGQGSGFSGIGFISDSLGWVAADLAHATANGGASWEPVDNIGRRINRFRIYSDTLGYAVGRTVYKYSSSGPVSVPTDDEQLPRRFQLGQNYPNPFNPTTVIPYQLAEAGDVEVVIHNLLGQPVRTLFRGRQSPGAHTLLWDGKNNRGELAASGVYLYHIRTGSSSSTRKMLLMR